MKFANPTSADVSLTEALDYLHFGVAILDKTDRIRYCNQHLVNMFPCLGPDAGNLLGSEFKDLAACKIENGITGGNGVFDTDACLAQRMSQHRNPHKPVVELPLVDGRWIEVTETLCPNSGMTVSWLDITRRKRTQLQLEDAIVSTTDGYAIWCEDQKLQSCNRRFAERMTGLNRSAILGLSLREVLERSLANRIFKPAPSPRQWLLDREQDHKSGNSEAVLETTEGKWLRIANQRTRDGCISTILSDASEQYQADRNANERLVELEKTSSQLNSTRQHLTRVSKLLDKAHTDVMQADAGKTAFLRNMSHELRTPLNSIIGFSEILKKELYGPLESIECGEYAELIQASGECLLDLINRILDLSKLESGRYVIYPERLNLMSVVEEAVGLQSRIAGEKSITLTASVENTLPEIYADESAILQVMKNILDNAIKFTPNGGKVRAVGSSVDGGVRLSITDDGIGIDASDIERFTLPFERGNSSLADDHQSSGLGLPIAKSLTTLQGGTLSISSEPGHGTTVDLWFPRADLFAAAIGDTID